jgi:hypothetical protein
MRAPAPPLQPIPPMPMPLQIQNVAAPNADLPAWTPEARADEDFAQVAAQARLGVQRKPVDEATRRKRQRLLTACGIAVVVAAAILLLIEKFYDPDAWARDRAIAAEVSRMAEQQKATDDLTLIELDIERAIMNNDLQTARSALAKLVERSPSHARREFLQASIDRAAELQELGGRGRSKAAVPATVAAIPAERSRSAGDTASTARTTRAAARGQIAP